MCLIGVFRVACELTLRLLREHKDTVMSILDAFIHDPLVEWEDEKRKMNAKVPFMTSPSTSMVDGYCPNRTGTERIERKTL